MSTFHSASDSSTWFGRDLRIANCQRIGYWSTQHLRLEYGKQDLVLKMNVPKTSFMLGNLGIYYVLLDLEKRCWPDLNHPLPFMAFPFHFVEKQRNPA